MAKELSPVDKVIKQTGMFLRPTGKGHAQRYGDPKIMGWSGVDDDGCIKIDTTIVVALSHWEASRYRREYKRQIKEGCVQKVDAEVYRAFVKASHAAPPSAPKGNTPKKETGATKRGGKPSKE